MSETKHTPLPWDVQNKGDLYGRSARHEIVAGVNVNGEKNLPTICKMPDLSERSYANAEFIVRAVNCHGQLVEAIEAILAEYGKDECFCTAEYGETGDENALCGGCLARAALAKAEGREA